MAFGRPSIALDYGGPAEYITPETGYLLPCENTAQVTEDLYQLFQNLLADRSLAVNKGPACLERVRTFTWPAKIDAAIEEYQKLL